MSIRIILIISLCFMQSCSFFKKENLSNSEKFELGINYFSKKKFQKAKDKFEFLVQNEQGTNLGLESTFYLAKTLFELDFTEKQIKGLLLLNKFLKLSKFNLI